MDGLKWVENLPGEVAGQRDVLRRLLAAISRDQCWRWLEVSCSLAQRRGDRWSDIDAGLGVADRQWLEALDGLPRLLEGLEDVVDALYHSLPAMGEQPHQRAFVQFASGVQLDLVAVPAHLPKGKQPESVILYDPDRLRTDPWDPSVLQPDAETIREWTFLGWAALADLAKYLRRGSLWEAAERLHEARSQVWRLWAAGMGLRYPMYGLTTVLDHPESSIPPGIEATVAALDAADVHRAALACSVLLREMAKLTGETWHVPLPDEYACYVAGLLDRALSQHATGAPGDYEATPLR